MQEAIRKSQKLFAIINIGRKIFEIYKLTLNKLFCFVIDFRTESQ